MNKITVSHTIEIEALPEKVWDYTQNWKNRSKWDFSVIGANYLSESPPIIVDVKGAGGTNFKVTYKLSDRPKLTTLVMSDLNSFWIKGGGGSWKYSEKSSRTLWTQTNTLILRDGLLGQVLRPFMKFLFSATTRKIMGRAKQQIEGRP